MQDLTERLLALARELRRRRVLHTAGIYLVAAWAAVEVTSTVFPLLFLPDWAARAVVVAAFLGLPVVLVLAWAFDVTPEGVQRAESAPGRKVPVEARVALVAVTVVVTGLAGWGARGFWLREPADSTASLDPARVAVLYFDDFSEGHQLGYVADGLTEALIHELAQIGPLEVVSRNGVKPFRNHSVPEDSLALLLNAGTIVEGSVESDGDQLRATVQMIDARTGVHTLSVRLQRSGDDVLELRDEIVREAARRLGQTLGRELELARVGHGPHSGTAWSAVQQAHALMDQADTLAWTLGDQPGALATLGRADSLFAIAMRHDPRWIEPLIGRAAVRLVRTVIITGAVRAELPDSAAEPLRQGLLFVNQALQMEPRSSEALSWRGRLRYRLSWIGGDAAPSLVEEAESDYRQAVAVDSSNAEAWVGLAEALRSRGEFGEAALAADRALAADPFLIHAEKDILFTLSHVWLELERFDRAAEFAAEGRRRYPAEPMFAAELLVLSAGWAGPHIPVDSAWALVHAVENGFSMTFWPHGHLQVAAVLARAGQPDSALAVVARVKSGEPSPWLDYFEANVRLQLGEPGEAIDRLADFVRAVPHRRDYIAQDWWWRPLADSTRFKELVADSTE